MSKFNKPINYSNAQYAFNTNIGRVRLSNEDSAKVLANAYGQYIMVVCDGMGGENKGDYASKATVDMLLEKFNAKGKFLTAYGASLWLAHSIKYINKTLYKESISSLDYHGMGTTMTVVMLVNKSIIVSQIGDSRCYFLRDHKLIQMTEDQSYVGYLFRTGQITEEEMTTHPKRNLLTNAVANLPSVNLDIHIYEYKDEKILLCSDGLYNNVPKATLENVLNNTDDATQKVNELINIANANGGSDNIAVVIWEDNKQ